MNAVKTMGEDEILAAVRGMGVESVLDQTFEAMRDHFLPEKAHGLETQIQYVVGDEGTEFPYVMAIKDGACELRKEQVSGARVTLTADLVSFLKLVGGAVGGPQLFMSGKLKIAGDLMFSQQIANLFATP